MQPCTFPRCLKSSVATHPKRKENEKADGSASDDGMVRRTDLKFCAEKFYLMHAFSSSLDSQTKASLEQTGIANLAKCLP